MRRVFLLGAALVVLAANGGAVWQATRNRAEPRGGTLQLTEREASLQTIALESSVTLLRLNWKTEGQSAERHRPPAWLDINKIAELGFDCTLPASDPRARRHYSSQPARRVFVVLEYQAALPTRAEKRGQANTGLMIVDAARDPQTLRERFPDSQKHIICRGLVGLMFRRHDQAGAPLSTPVLEAWVGGLRPSELSVPKPTNQLLTTLRRDLSEGGNRPIDEPRFAARIHWGRNYEPWVDEIRLIGK